jgi:hypothetical protein
LEFKIWNLNCLFILQLQEQQLQQPVQLQQPEQQLQ